jgi:dUTP pyrophosphatase
MDVKILDNPEGHKHFCYAGSRKGDAGIDLIAMADTIINKKESEVVSTGICVEIPKGYFGLVTHRSSIAFKLDCICSLGIIDPSYRGEVKLKFFNLGTEAIFLKAGSRVAQLILVPYSESASIINIVDELSSTARGANGFGSTGQ